jgi:hypothetical protein
MNLQSAGAGSHGGSGGRGGRVDITIDERHTNLLLAVDWNVDGGMGGAAGRNGSPGNGGPGGKGGQGYAWSVQRYELRSPVPTNNISHLKGGAYRN